MAKAELGMKLTCESCGARFYDLNKQPGICPKCGTANARPVIFKASRARVEDKKAPVAVKAPPKPAPADEDEAPEAADDDEEDEAVIEDTSDLGEDDAPWIHEDHLHVERQEDQGIDHEPEPMTLPGIGRVEGPELGSPERHEQ